MTNAPITPALPEDLKREKDFRVRFFFLKLLFALFFVVVAGKLVVIQIIEAPKYQKIARKQYEATFMLPATRGKICDREGNALVTNTMYKSFSADPRFIGDEAEDIAAEFSRIFGKPASSYLEKLRSERGFVWLERGVNPDLAKKIAPHDGIVVMNEPKRVYQYDDVGGTLLGYTDIDNRGISGLELELDKELRGVNGSVVLQRDGLGRTRPSADFPRVEPVDGKNVTLTISLKYQAIVEEELRRGIAQNKAEGGLAVMMNPKTGEILALAVCPGVNPNHIGKFDMSAARDRVVTDVFEPGSVFKVVTASAAYENRIVAPDTRFNAEHGSMRVYIGDRYIRTINDTHEYDWLTFEDAIELSSNIVLAKVGKLIGPERFYRQARDFGFGTMTGVDLPGEVRGKLKRPNEWSGTTLMTMAYGYEVAVTPMQIVQAYAAVANKGFLMRPYIVASVRDESGEMVREQRPEQIRQVISAQTAQLLTEAFEGVVNQGTAKEVKSEGIRIAGKTGTSRKIVDGKYNTQDFTASFAGFFPVEDPQIVLLVMMDNPRARGYYGGITSGPIFKAIAERIVHSSWKFSHPLMTQEPGSAEGPVTVPDVRSISVALAEKILEGHNLSVKTFGKGDVVVRQSPAPGQSARHGDGVTLVLNGESTPQQDGTILVPDLRGMSLRRAVNLLVVDDFDIRIEGSGVVVRQTPAAGQKVMVGTTVQIGCAPRTPATAVLY
ncbi:MAG TPA: penicillin-binding transpeptidase domain-containing protein [Bacteroidota bacterium]|nr:penicillin-binding transpeptidase domain-containing protein [Bacteroidota bacterium]